MMLCSTISWSSIGAIVGQSFLFLFIVIVRIVDNDTKIEENERVLYYSSRDKKKELTAQQSTFLSRGHVRIGSTLVLGSRQ